MATSGQAFGPGKPLPAEVSGVPLWIIVIAGA